jgi:hypothetical protein
MKKPQATPPSPRKPEGIVFAFGRINFILTLAGLLLIGLGFILMIGGGAESPSEFSEEIFNTRRLVVSPLLILAGYVIGIVAIMYRPSQKKAAEVKE